MDSRGSMAVEFLVILPVLMLLWRAVGALHGVNATAAGAAADTRTCAWRAAMKGCLEVPPGCEAALEATGEDAETTRAGGELALELPFLRDAIDGDLPRLARARRDTAARSPLLGEVAVRARHLVPCDVVPARLDWREVVRRTCNEIGGDCP